MAKQRIIKKTSIYIFDEAFGNIDIDREKKILNNIFEYLKERRIYINEPIDSEEDI